MDSEKYSKRLKDMQSKGDVQVYYEDFFKFVGETHKTVLDAGSGTGYITAKLKERYNIVTTIDKYFDADIKGSLTQIPLQNGSFDSVYCLDVLEHIEDDSKALGELWRVTKKDGYLYMIVPNGIWERIKKSADPTHIHFYNYRNIKRLLKRSGYKIIDIRASGLPLINRLSFGLARKLARFLYGPLLTLASPSFWIKARKVPREDTLIMTNPAGWGKSGVMGGAEMRVLDIRKNIIESNCIIAASSNLTDVLPAYLLSRLKGFPFLVYFQTDAYDTTWYKTYKKMRSQNVTSRFKIFLMSICGMISLWLIKKADKVYCFSFKTIDFLHSIGCRNTQLITHEPSMELIGAAKPHPQHYDAVFVGRLEPVKGIDDLYYIWNEVIKIRHFAKLLVIGGEGITTKNIHHTGYIPQLEIYSYLKNSSIFIFPSKSEGWSQAVLEAYYCGLTIVGYDIPFMREFKERYGGVKLIPKWNKDLFAKEVACLI